MMTTMDFLNAAESVSSVVSSTVDDALGILGTAAAVLEAPNVTLVDQAPAQPTDVPAVTVPLRSATSVDAEVGEFNIQRFVRLKAGDWATTTKFWENLFEIDLPDLFFVTGTPMANMSRNYWWVHSDFEFQLMVNANAGYAGALVLVFVPNEAEFHKTSFMNFPHAILNCSYNTSCSLIVPYIHFKQFVDIDKDTDPLGRLKLMCLSYLKAPANSSTSISYTVYGRLRSPNLQAFRNLQAGPKVRVEASLGAQYLGGSEETDSFLSTALMSENTRPDPRTVGVEKLVSLKDYAAIPCLVKRVTWKDTDTTGKKLEVTEVKLQWDYSDPPGLDAVADDPSKVNNLDFLSSFYSGYSGDLVIRIVLVGSRLNQGKLLFAFFPGEDNAKVNIDEIKSVQNAFLHVVDLGAGTTSEFTLPFVCQQTYRPVGDVHGKLGVYVLNKLTYTAACANEVGILIFMSASPGFKLVYPKTSERKFAGMVEDSGTNPGGLSGPSLRNLTVPADQVLADHMALDSIKKRGFMCELQVVTKGVAKIKLEPGNRSLGHLFKSARFWSGSLNLHCVTTSSMAVYYAHSFYEIEVSDTDRHFALMTTTGYGAVASIGRHPVSFKVPFYSLTPYRLTTDLGYLYVVGLSGDNFTVSVVVTFGDDVDFHFWQSPPQATAHSGAYYSIPEALHTTMPLLSESYGETKVPATFADGLYQSDAILFSTVEEIGLVVAPTPPAPVKSSSFSKWREVAREMTVIKQCYAYRQTKEWPHFYRYMFPRYLKSIHPHVKVKEITHMVGGAPLYEVWFFLDTSHNWKAFGPTWIEAGYRAAWNAVQHDAGLGAHMAACILLAGDVERNPGPVFKKFCQLAGFAYAEVIEHDVMYVVKIFCGDRCVAKGSSRDLVGAKAIANASALSLLDNLLNATKSPKVMLNDIATSFDLSPFVVFDRAQHCWVCDLECGNVMVSGVGHTKCRAKEHAAEMYISRLKALTVVAMDFIVADPFKEEVELLAMAARLPEPYDDPEVEELLIIGGVELNPGPSVVYRDRGIYQHYGLLVDNQIVHLNSEDILETALSGKVSIKVEPYVPGDWIVKEEIDLSDTVVMTRLDRIADTLGKFSLDFNCETVVNRLIQKNVALQSLGFKGLASVVIGLCVGYMMLPQGPLREMITGISDAQFSAIQAAMDFLDPKRFKQLCGLVITEACRTFVKGLLRMVCYAFVVAQNPTIGTIIATGLLAGLDVYDGVSSIKNVADCFGTTDAATLISKASAALDVDSAETETVSTFVKLREKAMRVVKKPEGLSDMTNAFNKTTLTSRNMEYWLRQIKELLQWLVERINPTNAKTAINYLDSNQNLIISDIAAVNDMVESVTDSGAVTMEQRERWATLVERMKKHHLAGMLAVSDRRNQLITSALNALYRLPIGQKRPMDRLRMEPIAIHLKGLPGQGKSMLMSRLAGLLAKRLDSAVYDHPPNCKYYDNYAGQKVHTIDEFLACRDEEDAAMILQLISSSHCVLPMADIHAKGMYYRGEFLITSSNTSPISETKLRYSDALARRFKVYEIRARKEYLQDGLGKNKVFDAEKAIADGSYLTGSCWEASECNGLDRDYERLSMDDFVEDLLAERKRKMAVLEKMLKEFQGNGCVADSDLFDHITSCTVEDIKALKTTLFDLPMCNVKVYQSKLYDKVAKIWESLKTPASAIKDKLKQAVEPNNLCKIFMAIELLLIVVTVGMFIYSCHTWSSPKKIDPEVSKQGPYDGTLARPNLKKTLVKRPEGDDTPLHILRNCVELRWEGGSRQKALAIGGRRIVTNNHNLGSGDVEIVWQGGSLKFPSGEADWCGIDQEGDGPTDLVLMEYPKRLGFQFPDISRHISNADIGRDATLYVMETPGFYKEVKATNVQLRDYQVFTGLGHLFGHVEYYAVTKKGDCGSPLLQKVKGTWKVISIHNGGCSAGVACGIRLKLLCGIKDFEGLVEQRNVFMQKHQASATTLRKSPCYEAFPVLKEPAVLKPTDKRLERPIVDLVKEASMKYNSDVFEVDDFKWTIAKYRVESKLRAFVDLGYCVSVENAIRGLDSNPIDSSTSPGAKYAGLRKKDLFRIEDDGVWVSDRLRSDVNDRMCDLKMGKLTTLFTAHLKDELRPLEKIKIGKTRVIEGCELDYVVLYRMIMSSIYRDIYAAPTVQSGIAVGCDPLLDAHNWYLSSSQFSKHLAMDYSGFDGSLSEKIMREAVSVLSRLHEDPDLVVAVHEPVVVSRHWVSDEVWDIRGGMPSGSPCTSVLNSVVNLLMLEYMCVDQGVDEHEMYVYGDDCVLSHDGDEMVDIKGKMLEYFGARVTPATKKGDEFYVPLSQVQFLKRNFVRTSVGYLGRLDIGTIEQSLMWTRNLDCFDQQLISLAVELVPHGQVEYQRVSSECDKRFAHNRSRFKFPRWHEALVLLALIVGLESDAIGIRNFKVY